MTVFGLAKAASDPMLRALHAVVNEGARLTDHDGYGGNDPDVVKVHELLIRVRTDLFVEMVNRKLAILHDDTDVYPFVGADMLTRREDSERRAIRITNSGRSYGNYQDRSPWTDEELALNFTGVNANELRVICCAACEVVDFSMLGIGVRDMATSIWHASGDALRSLGIEDEWSILSEVELDDEPPAPTV